MRNQKYISIVSFLIVYILTGCNGGQTIVTQSLTKTEPALPTFNPTLSVETVTITPTKRSETPTPSEPIPNTPPISKPSLSTNLTPLPTLEPDQAQEKILDLLQNNAGCELPCFWGITPGETAWQNAERFLSSFTERIDQGVTSTSVVNGVELSTTLFGVYSTIPGYPDMIASSYRVTNGTVDKISVSPIGTELRYQLHQVLSRFGIPDEILLDLLPDTPAGKPWFSFYLFYPERGITIIYSDEAHSDEDKIKVCPEGLGPSLTLIPPGSQTLYWMKRDAYDAPFLIPSLDDIPGMSIEIFYDTLKESGNCLFFDSSLIP